MANVNDTAAINTILHSEMAKQYLPSDLKLLWSAKPSDRIANNKRIYELYCLRITTPEGSAPLRATWWRVLPTSLTTSLVVPWLPCR